MRQFDRYDFYDKDFFNTLWNLQTEFLSLSKNVRGIAYFHHGPAPVYVQKSAMFFTSCVPSASQYGPTPMQHSIKGSEEQV